MPLVAVVRTTLRSLLGRTSFRVSACGGRETGGLQCQPTTDDREARGQRSHAQTICGASLTSPQRGQLVDGASRNWETMQSWQKE